VGDTICSLEPINTSAWIFLNEHQQIVVSGRVGGSSRISLPLSLSPPRPLEPATTNLQSSVPFHDCTRRFNPLLGALARGCLQRSKAKRWRQINLRVHQMGNAPRGKPSRWQYQPSEPLRPDRSTQSLGHDHQRAQRRQSAHRVTAGERSEARA
jgi:hypothetical protein